MTTEPAAATTILVAEDDRVISDVIRFNLERAGYRTTIARNGLEAWGLLQTVNFDCLITDYQMPGMTGEEVCRAFRSAYPFSRMPVIFLSARGLELNAGRLKEELGIDALLYKPFSPRELVERIAKVLEKTTLTV